MIHQPQINHPKNVDFAFSEGQVEEHIKTNSPYQEEIIEEEYNRPTDNHYNNNSELKRYLNTSKMVHEFLQNQTNLNNTIKLTIEKH